MTNNKKRVFSGTRATGRLHLGNYLGAVKGYIALQNDPSYECVYMAVDTHVLRSIFEFIRAFGTQLFAKLLRTIGI